MNSQVAFLVAFATFVVCTTATPVRPCGGNLPSPMFVDIKGCTQEPCPLITGTSALMDITFRTPIFSKTLKPKVRATVGPITVTYPMPPDQEDACESLLEGYCPVDAGETVVYHLDFPISGFPHIGVVLEFSLIGDNNTVFQCFKVACKVQAADSFLAQIL